MSDATLNRFLAYGTDAQRLAFTPTPPTPASGPSPAYFWWTTDTLKLWAFDTTWHDLTSFAGQIALAGVISPAALGADQNDYNPTGLATANALRLSASIATVNITGLSGGASGRVALIFNVGASNNLVLKNESVSSLAANRFDATGDVTLAPSAWTLLWYDGTSSRWRVLVSGGGGGTGTVTHTGTLTANALILGNGGVDITALGSLGTTTTVLHGNAAGAPTFGAVSLTADVTGTLPVANGGTGATTLTAHGVLIGEATSAVAATAAGAQGQALVAQAAGTDPAFQGIGWVLISEQTPGAVNTVSFTSIPAVYRDLKVVVRGRGTNASTSVSVHLNFNTDVGANYDFIDYEISTNAATNNINGSAAATTFFNMGYMAASTSAAGAADASEAIIYDYRGTTFQKAVMSESTLKTGTASVSNFFRTVATGYWRSTAAVTQVDVSLSAGNYATGSVVSLYGSL